MNEKSAARRRRVRTALIVAAAVIAAAALSAGALKAHYDWRNDGNEGDDFHTTYTRFNSGLTEKLKERFGVSLPDSAEFVSGESTWAWDGWTFELTFTVDRADYNAMISPDAWDFEEVRRCSDSVAETYASKLTACTQLYCNVYEDRAYCTIDKSW